MSKIQESENIDTVVSNVAESVVESVAEPVAVTQLTELAQESFQESVTEFSKVATSVTNTDSVRKNPYEVVFFARYNNRDSRYTPTREEILTFFKKYGDVDHLDYNNEKFIAYVYMAKLSTTQTFLRTRSTIANIIAEMTPETKFYVSVARSNNNKRYRRSDRSNNISVPINSDTRNFIPRKPRNRFHGRYQKRNSIDITDERQQNSEPRNDRYSNRPARFRLESRQHRSSDNVRITSNPQSLSNVSNVSGKVPIVEFINRRNVNINSDNHNNNSNKYGFNIRPVRGFNDSGRNRRPSPRNPSNLPRRISQARNEQITEPKRVYTYRPVRRTTNLSDESN